MDFYPCVSPASTSAFDRISLIGLCVYCFGVVALIIVVSLLGRFWTVKLLIARDHALVRHPLFRIVRHPNYYLNLLPELIGFALFFHAHATLVIGLSIYLIPLIICIRHERFVVCDRSAAPTIFDRIIALCAQAGFVPKIAQTSSLPSSVLTLIHAGEGVTLIPGSLQHVRFSDLAFCPLTKPTGTIELVMAWSPERDDVAKTAFLDFVRSKKKLIRSSLRVEEG